MMHHLLSPLLTLSSRFRHVNNLLCSDNSSDLSTHQAMTGLPVSAATQTLHDPVSPTAEAAVAAAGVSLCCSLSHSVCVCEGLECSSRSLH